MFSRRLSAPTVIHCSVGQYWFFKTFSAEHATLAPASACQYISSLTWKYHTREGRIEFILYAQLLHLCILLHWKPIRSICEKKKKGTTQHGKGHCSLAPHLSAVTHLTSNMAVGFARWKFVPKDMARAHHLNSEMPSGNNLWHLLTFTMPPCC